MSARLRLSRILKRDGTHELRVDPGPGGYVDTYRVRRADILAFAWGVLADLQPDEAEAAAAEAGGQLVQFCTQTPDGRTRAPASPPRKGTKKAQILSCLRQGPLSIEAIQALVPDAMSPSSLLYELAGSGFAERAPEGGPWRLTPVGEAIVAEYPGARAA